MNAWRPIQRTDSIMPRRLCALPRNLVIIFYFFFQKNVLMFLPIKGGAMIARVNFSEYGNYEDVPLDQLQAASSSSSSSASNKTSKTSSALPFPAPATMPMAPPPLSMPEDEDLANLLMAWYFSGYYTGLYQAKRHLHD